MWTSDFYRYEHTHTHTNTHTHTHTHTHTYYILTGEWDLKTFLKESYAIMHSLYSRFNKYI